MVARRSRAALPLRGMAGRREGMGGCSSALRTCWPSPRRLPVAGDGARGGEAGSAWLRINGELVRARRSGRGDGRERGGSLTSVRSSGLVLVAWGAAGEEIDGDDSSSG